MAVTYERKSWSAIFAVKENQNAMDVRNLTLKTKMECVKHRLTTRKLCFQNSCNQYSYS